MRKKRGFTLIEILIVLAIIAILCSILLPVFSSVRRKARQSSSASNLRQCWLTLRMYCDDNGGDQGMPSGDIVAEVLKKAPTCDPNDSWRSSCDEVFGPPLVGSYAYVRFLDIGKTQTDWDRYLQLGRNPILMSSIYYASVVPDRFHGFAPALNDPGNFVMPDRQLRLRLDGSVKLETPQYTPAPPGNKLLLTWDMAWTNSH